MWLTVEFSPEQIADAIMEALAGSGDSYLLGGKAKTQEFLSKILPAPLARRVVMQVTGY
jgi:hypothetical protein